MTMTSEPRDERRRRRAAPSRTAMLDIACAQIGMLLDAPRAARRDEASRVWRESPSVVEALLRAAAKATPGTS